MTDSDENLDKKGIADNIIAVPKRFNLPSTWKSLLEIFRRKHSSPRKKHLRLLTKFVPNGIAAQIKNDAATLAERYVHSANDFSEFLRILTTCIHRQN